MYSKIILQLFLFIFFINVKCEVKEGTESKKVLPYFRRKVEELEDAGLELTTERDDAPNLVSFLVQNVREIFDDTDENSEAATEPYVSEKNIAKLSRTSIAPRKSTTKVLFKPHLGISTTEANMSRNSIISTSTHDVMLVENLPLTTLLDKKQESSENLEMNIRNDNQRLPNDKSFYSKNERDFVGFPSMEPYQYNSSEPDSVPGDHDPRRSCIMCNNVDSVDCNDPKNKLIPSIMCNRDDDLCYSLHTPFGIIDRGCFNVNHNLTTYVCSCNLCNYISISEMPFMFTKKRDWVDNVIELSRTRHFRNSVFKDMSCLRCEVNTTTKTGDMLDSANCLEGNIGNLPVEDCEVDEVCAVRALRADGYIWRGCLKTPLYNYWFAVCDHDLCNYDTLVALYDFVI